MIKKTPDQIKEDLKNKVKGMLIKEKIINKDESEIYYKNIDWNKEKKESF